MNHIEFSSEEDPDPSIFFGYWLFYSRIVQKHTAPDPKDKFFNALTELTSCMVTLLFEKHKYRHNEQKMMEIAGCVLRNLVSLHDVKKFEIIIKYKDTETPPVLPSSKKVMRWVGNLNSTARHQQVNEEGELVCNLQTSQKIEKYLNLLLQFLAHFTNKDLRFLARFDYINIDLFSYAEDLEMSRGLDFL